MLHFCAFLESVPSPSPVLKCCLVSLTQYKGCDVSDMEHVLDELRSGMNHSVHEATVYIKQGH